MNKILSSQVIPPDSDDRKLTEIIKDALSQNPNLISIQPSKWIAKNGTPNEQGNEGDFYLDTLLGNIYVKTKEGWQKQGNLKGFKGDTGARGEKGDKPIAGIDYFIPQDGKPGKNANPEDVVPLVMKNIRQPKDGKDGEDGKDGREIELRKSKTHIQWHYVGERDWTNLVALSELKGPPGSTVVGGGGGGIVQSVRAGANVTVNSSDPANPIVSAAGGGGGGSGVVEAVVAGTHIDVDSTDPANPVVSVESLTAADITDFDAEVSNNTDVAANTSARHAAVTVADSSEIDLTLTGQQISAAIVPSSIDEGKLDASVNASLDLADSSVQPGDDVSDLNNDAGYTTNTGTVDTANSPNANEFARFTDADTIEGRTAAEVKADLDLEIGTDVQAYDADLTTWAGITPAAGVGTFLATPSSANLKTAVTDETGSGALVFANSPTLVTPTGIVKGDVGLGNVDNTSNATERAATRTLTNARINPRVTSVASSATPTPNADTDDLYDLTAQAAAAAFADPTGTPVNGQKLMIRIKDNGTARALTWGTAYVAGGVALPSTTVLSKILTLGFMYNTANSLNKWQCVASAQEA